MSVVFPIPSIIQTAGAQPARPPAGHAAPQQRRAFDRPHPWRGASRKPPGSLEGRFIANRRSEIYLIDSEDHS
ncbi:hypothetical protein LMG28688_05084 [Paraburkholderia caffeinitolerans]|uniref:Uncharacterized protein n=1 Tax=Paraburkholderia caffeinitolerans TaxID=1723730 RepID=A0A6J5GIY0_9BURK|nr:hypothetical protein LMG28688_05084 [Paraburkholderia caffeinitolerans]